MDRKWSHPCPADLVTLTAHEVPRSSVFEGSLARKLVLDLSCGGAFSPACHVLQCLLVGAVSDFRGRRKEIRHFWRVRPSFCVAGAGHRTLAHPCSTRTKYFVHVAKTLAGMG